MSCGQETLAKGFVPFPSESQFRVLAYDFEVIHGNPYIVGAIDDSHTQFLAPIICGKAYCYQKFFHSAILQGIVDVNYNLWGFESGWAGGLHDWYVFQKPKWEQNSWKENKCLTNSYEMQLTLCGHGCTVHSREKNMI